MRMVNWLGLEDAAPELARTGKERLDKARVALLGTLRRDGSPRISPVEPFWANGELLFGAMAWSRKAEDLRRDPRCVLHNAIVHGHAGDPEVKLYGRASEVRDSAVRNACADAWWIARPQEIALVFALDIEQAILVEWDLQRGEMMTKRWSLRSGLSVHARTYP